jgi:hypothetical protein
MKSINVSMSCGITKEYSDAMISTDLRTDTALALTPWYAFITIRMPLALVTIHWVISAIVERAVRKLRG